MKIDAARLVAALVVLLSAGCKSSSPSASAQDDGGQTTDGGGAGDTISAVCTSDSRSKGEACSCSMQCESGFCADGVCCETACSGTCLSCGLTGSLGTCSPTPAGGAPRLAGECKSADKVTCGLDGTCDGTGQCRNHVEGTVCKPGTCDGDAVVGTHTCDGAGACKQGATTVCAPFSCDVATNLCFAKCSTDLNCVSGRKCLETSCGPKLNGSVCERDAECASEHCTGGVCCNTACDGACRSCNIVGQLGICQPLAKGLPHAMCSPQTPATCGTTGFCDGFGSCASYPATSVCAASTCSGATMMNSARACDGLGVCLPAEEQSCGSYRCANGKCNSRCTTAADCADGIACVNNNCGAKVDGQPCTANSECVNLHCVRDTATGPGICCNTECTGACRSCAVAGALGRCTSVASGGMDPRGMCSTMAAGTCGTDGRCNGAGACRVYATGTLCGAETCVSDLYTAPSTCNGAGLCVKPTALSCFPYHCNTNRCFTACTANAQCVAPNTCGMNGAISSCGLKPLGASCSAPNECSSNFCAQGVCCNSACNAACRACDLASTTGTCTNVNSGVDPRRLCAVQAQSTCGTTGQCSAGACARWAAGTQCRAAGCLNASTRTLASTCNSAGICATAATASCAPGRCDSASSTCDSTCTTDAQCTAPAVCVAGACSAKLGNGTVCSAAADCMSGFCVDGRCCGTACTGACQTCGNASGTCGPVANATADALCGAAAPPCGRTGLCTGGACAVTANGTSCTDGDACNGLETCQAGTCSPGTPLVCRRLDICHVVGTCTDGVCSNPNAPDTRACGAGPMCTAGSLKGQDHCDAGACVAGPSTPCPSGTCADATTCGSDIPPLPVCRPLQNCRMTPARCVCASGSACGTILPWCLPS